MDKAIRIAGMKKILEPYGLHDLDDVCERVYHDCQADPMHEATILAMAIEKCRDPVAGEDSFGDLTWRAGPHPKGLPMILIEMERDHEIAEFSTRFPLTEAQLDRDFHADKDGDKPNGVVADYVDEQLDQEDRNDVWRYICEDIRESALCQAEALRIEREADWQKLLVHAVTVNNRRGVRDAIEQGADVNRADSDGNTPMHLAARNSYHRMILPLIHAGAKVDEVNNEGQSPLHLAAAVICAPACLVLLAHNADPKRLDNQGRMPFRESKWEHEHEQGI